MYHMPPLPPAWRSHEGGEVFSWEAAGVCIICPPALLAFLMGPTQGPS